MTPWPVFAAGFNRWLNEAAHRKPRPRPIRAAVVDWWREQRFPTYERARSPVRRTGRKYDGVGYRQPLPDHTPVWFPPLWEIVGAEVTAMLTDLRTRKEPPSWPR